MKRMWILVLAVMLLMGTVAGLFLSGGNTSTPNDSKRDQSQQEIGHWHSILFDPNDDQSLLLGTHSGLYRRTVGSSNWQVAGDIKGDMMTVVVDRQNPNIMYASGHDITVKKSVDGGKTWKFSNKGLPDNADIHALAVSPNESSILYAYVSSIGIYSSSDRGESWTKSGDLSKQAAGITVDPSDRNHVFTLQEEGLFESKDGAKTWSKIPFDYSSQLTGIQSDPEKRNVYFVSTADKGIVKTIDGGKTWQSINNGLQNTAVVLVGTSAKNPKKFVAVTLDGNIYVSENQGDSWRKW